MDKQKSAAFLSASLLTLGAAAGTPAAELPVPCIAGSCGSNASSFVSSGVAGAAISGNTLTVNQATDAVTLNWQSFNISEDGKVEFRQPGADSVALNRIWQSDPSRIFGSLTANGQIYLINQNGILFGDGARVNTSGLVASSLNITPEAVNRGIAQAARESAPAFREFTDASGAALPAGSVRVEKGATLETSSGGQILLLAPQEVVNNGTIKTPDGQALLAAGRTVYLATSNDPNLRGLLVEVGVGGTVTNGETAAAVGQIIAERGNVTLAGLAVNQNGRVTATTSVRANGSIRLQARDGATVEQQNETFKLGATTGGTLTLGKGSRTEVNLDATSTERTVDANVQPRSKIELDGKTVLMLENSQIAAKGGTVDVIARANANVVPSEFSSEHDGSRIFMAPSASIDVSGANIDLAMDRNVVRVELRGNQLRDSPLQRDGALRGEAVFVDIRAKGTRADGTTWQGTPIGDVAGDISVIQRDVSERNLAGGTVQMRSAGDLLLSAGSTIDVSGGSIQYASGFLNTTQLLGADGRAYDISEADPDRVYQGILPSTSITRTHQRWGVTQVFRGYVSNPQGHYEQGYVEGKDAGSIVFSAPRSVLDATLDAHVTVGDLQRQVSQDLAAGALYRPFDQVPLGGRLTIGNAQSSAEIPDYGIQSIVVETPSNRAPLLNSAGEPFDPLEDELPETATQLSVRPDWLKSSGVSSVALYANDEVRLGADVAVSMPAQGQFSATAGKIDIAGSIDAPSGSISLTARPTDSVLTGEAGLVIADTARLTARGGWINENPAVPLATGSRVPLLIDGGTVQLAAREGDLTFASGALIDVSGGAWRRADGSVVAGRGGSVALSASPAEGNHKPATLALDGRIEAFSLGRSGDLSIAADSICIATQDCSGDDPHKLWIAPSLLEDSGFSSYTLTSNLRGLSVADGTSIRLTQKNFELLPDTDLSPTGTDVRSLSRISLLLDQDRSPVSLSLTTDVPVTGTKVDQASFEKGPILSIGKDAVVQTDPRGSISLQSNTRLSIEGSLIAPAGTIDLTLDPSLDVVEFLPSQTIYLGEQAKLLASGTSVLFTDTQGRQVGDVYAGGRVNLDAQRGSIVTAQGSIIDVSGTQADVDLRSLSTGLPIFERTHVATSGGTISFTAAESILASGTLRAQAGVGPGAYGGELNFSLDPTPRNDPNQVAPVFPLATRTIVLTESPTSVLLGNGAGVPDSEYGRAYLSAEQVREGGFGSLNLSAANLMSNSNSLLAAGEIHFEGNSSWALGQRLTLNAASLTASDGSNVNLSAAYFGFSQSDTKSQTLPADLVAGTGKLEVHADLIDFLGNVSLQGFETASFRSTGDIRARGVQLLAERSLRGSLVSSGDLSFESQQIYPSTLTDFRIESKNPTGRIEIASVSGDASPILSAGGRLSLVADTVQQSGVLRAPLGEISLQGRNLILDAGSTTSTSAAGQLIPFGVTQAGADWVYELPDKQLLVFAPGKDSLPQQRVELNGDTVDLRTGAVIDVSGGGDLLAYEFVPGVTGSRDVLSPTQSPNQFAILPSLSLKYAPYDQREYQGSSLRPGDTIYLNAAPGLAAGTYTLLPARYALLPGAMLVSASTGYEGIAAGEALARVDGSTVVAGARTFGFGTELPSLLTAFTVRPGTAALAEARYDSTKATQFFGPNSPAASASLRLPSDSGLLSVTAGSVLNLDGSLRASAVNGGRGAGLDISAESLRITAGTPAGGPQAGVVDIDATRLSALGAESILVGGSRRPSKTGTAVTAAARSVEIDSGARLEAPDLMVAAKETVTVESGAVLAATGSNAQSGGTLEISGDGALLRVSTGDAVDIARKDTAGLVGVLDLMAGASVQARGSVVFDASAGMNLSAALDVAGSAVNVSSSRISLGSVPDAVTGAALDTSQLASLNARELMLTSASSIDFYGDVQLQANALAFRTNEIRGIDGANVAIQSDALRMGNLLSADAGPVSSTGTGSLSLATSDLIFEKGGISIDGFASTRFAARNGVSFRDESQLALGGDLQVETPAMTGHSGNSAAWTVTGNTSIVAPTDAAPVNVALSADALGGKFTLESSGISLLSALQFPSGQVTLRATGTTAESGVTLGAGASIDVRGHEEVFDDVAVYSPGGSVILSAAGGGGIRAESGSRIDVSGAAKGGNGGSLQISTPNGNAVLNGELLGQVAASAKGASVSIDAQRFGLFDDLTNLLNAGGFQESRTFRQRASGDITVGGSTVAKTFSLTADEGAIHVAGSIDASGQRGGRIDLAARNGVTVTGSLLAQAKGTNERGGDIFIDAGTGSLHLARSSQLDLSGTGTGLGGQLLLRADRDIVNTVLANDANTARLSIRGTVKGASALNVEGSKVYTDLDGSIDFFDVAAQMGNPLYDDATAFMASAEAIATALGRSEDETFAVRPGIEIRSENDLYVSAEWDLGAWRFDDQPGTLTLRAGRDLIFGASLTDGFVANRNNVLGLAPAGYQSWSYRLVAGADLTSANTMATLSPREAPENAGNLNVGFGAMIRTGTGDIDIAAARSVILSDAGSVIYTAGAQGPGIIFPINSPGSLRRAPYPTGGGDIRIDAGEDVVGVQSGQLVTDWLWRVGRPTGVTSPSATAWTVNFNSFRQNIGALGGGDVSVTAGRDLRDLSVNIASIGRQVGGTTPALSKVEVTGGGDMNIQAGGSVLGGTFFVGLGRGTIDAGDTITAATEEGLAPVLALGDASMHLSARGLLDIEGAVNPTLLPQGNSQGAGPNSSSTFSTYAPTSGITLGSTSGDVVLRNDVHAMASAFAPSMTVSTQDEAALQIYPPSLTAAALRGDVEVRGSMTLFPAPKGNLQLFADGDVRTAGTGAVQIFMSDTDPDVLPSITAPQVGFGVTAAALLGNAVSTAPNLLAPIPVHSDANQEDGVPDLNPVRFVARTGDIDFAAGALNDTSGLYSPKAVRLIAGRDIRDATVVAQHVREGDLSVIQAGRDLTYSTTRTEQGTLQTSFREIALDGPGTLQVRAGRNVDLQTSNGISTRGNLRNPALADSGANISVLTGMAAQEPQLSAFETRYLESRSEYDTLLLEFVEGATGKEVATKSQALDQLRTMSQSRRLELAQQVLFAELRASGRDAAKTGSGDFTRGFGALETLLPGSNPDTEKGEKLGYAGDISLFFSRIYSLDGGSINLLAPGGEINAGLATPPTAFGINKPASSLGIVAQGPGTISAYAYGDVQVNESRVFAADGGNILIWSTDGDIDAGRGAKTAISAPPPTITFDSNGRPQVVFPAALAGSGIQTLATSPGRKPGDVDLFAPRGVVNAGDAGIVAGNLTIAATAVLGANNIQVSGTAIGVPVDTGGLAAGLTGASGVASGAANAATASIGDTGARENKAPLSESALSWLEVFIEGFGEDVCKSGDAACLDRNRKP